MLWLRGTSHSKVQLSRIARMDADTAGLICSSLFKITSGCRFGLVHAHGIIDRGFAEPEQPNVETALIRPGARSPKDVHTLSDPKTITKLADSDTQVVSYPLDSDLEKREQP